MGDHDGGVDATGSGEFEGLDHVVGVATGGAHDVGGAVVHVVEVDLGGELVVGGAGEEVKAAVAAQDVGAEGDYGSDRCVAEHVVIAGAVGEVEQRLGGIVDGAGVHEVKVDTVDLLNLLGREERGGAVQASLVDIAHNNHGGLDVTV